LTDAVVHLRSGFDAERVSLNYGGREYRFGASLYAPGGGDIGEAAPAQNASKMAALA